MHVLVGEPRQKVVELCDLCNGLYGVEVFW